MKFLTLTGAVAALAFSTAAFAQETNTTIVEPMTAAQYVATAASSDMFEIQSSQMALATSQNPEVRQFAEHMVGDHSTTTKELTAAATAEGVPVPTTMIERHAQMLAQLEGSDAAAFDAAYLDAQVMAHREAVAVHTAYSETGDSEPLKAVAAKAVPIVTEHFETVQGLAN